MVDSPTLCVFAPSLFVTVTVEAGEDGIDDIHFHAGGQGFWVARMLRELGTRPVLCGPVGGESGRVLRGLASATGIDLALVSVETESPCYLHDRRNGERIELAEHPARELGRHDLDNLFGKTLAQAIDSGSCVITGRPGGGGVPVEFYRRLGADLAATEVMTIGDLHGEELDAFLEGGPLQLLKVSDEDLVDDGTLSDGDGEAAVWVAVDRLIDRGVAGIVVSRGERPVLARFGSDRFTAETPGLEPVDRRGAGDSMTAGLAAATVEGKPPDEVLRLGCGAGAANVTRHGLASADSGLIDRVAPLVVIKAVP